MRSAISVLLHAMNVRPDPSVSVPHFPNSDAEKPIPCGKGCLVAFLVLIAASTGLFVWWDRTDLNHHLDKLHEGMSYSEVMLVLPRRIVSREIEEESYFLQNGTEVRHFWMEISAGGSSAGLTFDGKTNLVVFPKKVRH